MIGLAQPLALLLLPLPLLARFLPPAPGGGPALIVPERVGARLAGGGAAGRGEMASRRTLAGALAWGLLVLALAGPRQLLPVPALSVSGRDLAIALDLSGSMVREDFALDGRALSRLDAVKSVGAEFARSRAGDRVGLILFGSEAYYAAPFTFDTEGVAQRIEAAEIGISGRATNIADAMGLALKRLAESDARAKVVILLSDGENNAGATNPRGVAELMAGKGVRVHTIALGTEDTEAAGAGTPGAVDTRTLRAIAEISGGTSFRVRTMDDLREVARALDALEPTAGEGLAAEIYRALWVWPGAGAAALCLWIGWRRSA